MLKRSAAISLVMLGIGAGAVGSQVALRTSAQAVPRMAALDRLIAEDSIRQRLALYALYADGDGENPVDTAALAQQLMTSDVVSKAYPAGGGAPRVMLGRGPIAATAPRAMPAADRPTATRHFLVQTYFDELGPTTAKTRTTAIFFRVTRNLQGNSCKRTSPEACEGKVVSSVVWVYHMTWRKTDAGWQISDNVLRDDT